MSITPIAGLTFGGGGGKAAAWASASVATKARANAIAFFMTPPVVRELVCLDLGGLDDRPPLVDLAADERAQRFGPLLLARGDVLAKVGQALAHRGIGERLDDGGVEAVDDRRRRAFRRGNRVPDR